MVMVVKPAMQALQRWRLGASAHEANRVQSRSQGRREPDCNARMPGTRKKERNHSSETRRWGDVYVQFRRAGGRVLFPPPLAGDPPEDAPVRHARVRAAAAAVERQALGPRGAGVHGDQLHAAVPAYLQHRDVAPGVRGGQDRGRRDDGGGREHGEHSHLHWLRVDRRTTDPSSGRCECGADAVLCCTYGRVAWRPQKLDEG